MPASRTGACFALTTCSFNACPTTRCRKRPIARIQSKNLAVSTINHPFQSTLHGITKSPKTREGKSGHPVDYLLAGKRDTRPEEQTTEHQSLMRISNAVSG